MNVTINWLVYIKYLPISFWLSRIHFYETRNQSFDGSAFQSKQINLLMYFCFIKDFLNSNSKAFSQQRLKVFHHK